MRSRRFFTAKTVTGLALVAALGAVYAHWGIFPGRAREMAIETIERLTTKKVTFGKVLYIPVRGLTFHDLRVYEPDGSPLFAAKKFSVDLKLIPFIRDKKIVIRQITLDSPVYDHFFGKPKAPALAPVKTKISGQIEVPVATGQRSLRPEDLAYGPDSLLPENVYIEVVQISNGLVRVHAAPGAPVSEIMHSINLRMGFRRAPQLTVDGYLKLGRDSYASLDLKGVTNIRSGEFDIEVRAKSGRVPQWLLDLQKNSVLALRKGRFLLNARIKSAGDGKLAFGGKADLKNAELVLNKKSRYTGEMIVESTGFFDQTLKTFERYRGRITLVNVNLFNVSKKIQRVDGVNGRITFEPDLLNVVSMRGSYKNVPFEAVGAIRSFKELLLSGEIRSRFSMRELPNLISEEHRRLLQKFELEGTCQAATIIRGSLRKPSEIKPGHKLIIQNATLTSKDRKVRLTNLGGELSVDTAGLKLSKMKFTSVEKTYIVDAFIPKTPGAPGRFTAQSDAVKISADYVIKDNTMVLSKGSAAAPGVWANFKGRILSLAQPVLDVSGDVKISLRDIRALSPAVASALDPIGLQGALHGPFVLKGAWNKPMAWNLKIDGAADELSFKNGLRLEGFEVQLRMADGTIAIPYFHAAPYGGLLGGKASFDLKNPRVFFDANLYANNVNLEDLCRGLKMKKPLTGSLLFQTTLRGFLKSPETYTGKGALSIKGGSLWETDQFAQMGRLPLVRVEGLDVVKFNDLSCTFAVRNKRFWTSDMAMFSETVDLSMNGTLGFDRQLDMMMGIRYSRNVIDGAYDTGGLAPVMVQTAENFISKYKISGPVDKPKYEKAVL